MKNKIQQLENSAEAVEHELSFSGNNDTKMGRRKVRDDSLILMLRSQGLTFREISKKIGMSTRTVARSLKQLRETVSNQDNSRLEKWRE